MKKQLLFFVMMLMPLMVSADYYLKVEINGIYYNLNSTTKFAEVTSVPSGTLKYTGSIVFPKTVTYGGVTYFVTSIGSGAFSSCSGLTSITIPNSVTSIEDYAFYECFGLTSVTIPNSVTSIGDESFYGCSGLTSVTIPNSVTSIGRAAFWGCSGLTSVTIPSSVTSIGSVAFYGCSGLTSIAVENGNPVYDSRNNCNAIVKTSTNELISGCKSTIIPNSVTSIGSGAFGSCFSLTSVTIPSSVTSIGSGAFGSCSSLTSVTIPSSVTSIGSGAFDSCSSLNSVIIPNSVTSIGSSAFGNCSSLTSITIPNSVTSIGSFAFGNCSSLTSVTIPNSVIFIGDKAFNGCTGLISVTIGNSVTSIGEYAFWNCSGLTSVTIPNSVASIGWGAFASCPGLTSITVEKGNTIYDSRNNCNAIVKTSTNELIAGCKSTIIPNSVTSIGDESFYGCSGLTSVTIPNSVTSIGRVAFYGCSGLTEVRCFAEEVPSIMNNEVFWYCPLNICTLYVPQKSLSIYQATKPWSGFGMIKSLTDGILFADDAVKALCVANWDTSNNGELGVDEAADVTDLGSVFANNTDITSFDELQYFTVLTSIGEQAFYYCSNLKSIIIPENVTTIGNRAFYVCSGLKSLLIPASVSNIEDRAFAYCSGLEAITVNENNQFYDSRNNCNALIQTNSNTLLVGCKNTKIPSSVKIIAEGAFRGCTELASIEIPEGVTTVGASAFRGCTGLTSVSLPSTITNIGNYAFSAFDEVYNLTTVRVGMTSPVAIASEVFPNRANSTLYVPKGSRAAYKAANYWKEFKNIVELDNGVPVKCEMPTITLLANGKIKVESATEGATCVTNITASNAEPLSDGEISLNTPLVVYTVTSHATKEGYDDSEVATATFRYEKAEGDINGDGNLNISDVVHLVNMILGQ